MDGSPKVIEKKINNEEVELTFFEDELLKDPVICNIKLLKVSLLSASKKVLRDIDRKNWESNEIEELRNLIISLDRYPN